MNLTINRQIDSSFIAHCFISIIEANFMTRAWVDKIFVADEIATKYDIWYADSSFWESDYEITVVHDGQKSPYEGANDCTTILTPSKVKSGFELMALKSPKHFADLMTENGDNITADVLFQYMVLGDIVFG